MSVAHQSKEKNIKLGCVCTFKMSYFCSACPFTITPSSCVPPHESVASALTAVHFRVASPCCRLAQSAVRAGVAGRPRRGVERKERGRAVPWRLPRTRSGKRKGPRPRQRRRQGYVHGPSKAQKMSSNPTFVFFSAYVSSPGYFLLNIMLC